MKDEIAGRVQGVGVVIAQPGAAQVQGAFEQRPGGGGFPPALQIHRGAVEQPGHVLLDPGEGAVGVGGDQDVRQELAPGWPGRRVVPRIVGRDRGTQQPNHQDGQVGLLVGLGAQDRGEQPMQLQGGGLDAGQPVLAQQPGQRGERQRIGGHGRQRVGQLGGVGGEQGQRDRLRPQVGGQGEQLQRSRGLGGQPIQGDLDAGGQRHRVRGGSALGQQLPGPLGQQGQIVLHADGGVGQVRPGLGQRQRQIPQRLRDPPRLTLGELRGAAAQQRDRLAPVEHIHPHRGGQLVPAGVAGGDHHLPTTPGQIPGQRRGILGIVKDQQPPVPLPQHPQQPRHRRRHGVGDGSPHPGRGPAQPTDRPPARVAPPAPTTPRHSSAP